MQVEELTALFREWCVENNYDVNLTVIGLYPDGCFEICDIYTNELKIGNNAQELVEFLKGENQ